MSCFILKSFLISGILSLNVFMNFTSIMIYIFARDFQSKTTSPIYLSQVTLEAMQLFLSFRKIAIHTLIFLGPCQTIISLFIKVTALLSSGFSGSWIHGRSCETINVLYFQQSVSVQTVSIKIYRVVVRENELLMFVIK